MQPAQFLTLATAHKWAELQALMAEMSQAAPYWRTQSTSGARYPTSGWDADWDRHFRLGVYKYIEWCELRPKPDSTGLTLADIAGVCEAIGFQTDVLADRVRVLGYRLLR